jgi:hypothetical protein
MLFKVKAACALLGLIGAFIQTEAAAIRKRHFFRRHEQHQDLAKQMLDIGDHEIKYLEFRSPYKVCSNGQCKDTDPVPADKLQRYRAMTRLQNVGYCEPEPLIKWNCAACVDPASPVKNTTNVKRFETPNKSEFGIIGVSHDLKTIFVVMQGVQHNFQWIRSFESKLIPFESAAKEGFKKEDIKVHDGFLRSWKEVYKVIGNDLKDNAHKFPDYTISFIGHSFGGSLVGIAGIEVALGTIGDWIKPNKVELYSFGASRVGNTAYAEKINKASFKEVARFVHSTDILAHFPFKTSKFDYMHYKGEVWLSTLKAKWVYCDDRDPNSHAEANNCANTVPFWRYSPATHISYWSRQNTALCPASPDRKPIEAEFLPEYALIKY